MYKRIINLINKYKYDNTKILYMDQFGDCTSNREGFKIKEIRKNPDDYNWTMISVYANLPEQFIREFQDKVEWVRISFYQTLSEDFIRESQNRVSWNNISLYQSLSKEFIIEFIDEIYFPYLLNNENTSQEVKDYCRMFI